MAVDRSIKLQRHVCIFNHQPTRYIHIAAQMWCLARMLPLIMGDLIPENDTYWDNFLQLLKFEEIVFAPILQL